MRLADPLVVEPTNLAGLWRLRWSPVSDERGSVQPIFVRRQIQATSLPTFVPAQANLTRSHRGVIRGIHGEDINKLVALLSGRVFAAAVDLRKESATFGQHTTFELGPGEGMFLSAGIGNGFQSVSSEESLYLYFFDSEWEPSMLGRHVNPLDTRLAIDWPIKDSLRISEKDRGLPSFDEIASTV